MNISIISTSPRQGSNSLKVAKVLQSNLENLTNAEIQLVDFEQYDIPMLGQGSLDKDNLTGFQKKFIGTLASGDLIIWVVPEYNWMTSGQVINAIHQLGNKNFDYLFDNKLFAMVGVSAGRGGRLPAIEMMTLLNKVIGFLNKYSVVSPQIFEAQEVPKNIDTQGNSLGNEIFDRSMQNFLKYSLEIAKRWFK